MTERNYNEGMKVARLLMVLSSISPLFILWAIRGNKLIPDACFLSFCAIMVIVPNMFLYLRIRTARKLRETREIVVGTAEDHRDHLLVYLFSMLLPFYASDIGEWRDLAATGAALAFIIFLFWHLNLHYMNLLFALFGYRVFTIYPVPGGNSISGKASQVLITQRVVVPDGERILAYRLSDTVFFEGRE